MINKFEVGQRVRVLAEDECVAPPPSSKTQDMLAGQTGTVVRLRKSGETAWVRMDLDLPRELSIFQTDEVLIYRGECQLIPSVAKDIT